MKTSICIDAVFFGKTVPLDEQIDIVAKAGFNTIEFWTWWDKDLDVLKASCVKHDVAVHCICTKFISLLDRTRKSNYLDGLRETIEVTKFLNCPNIISQVGELISDVPREEQIAQTVETLKEAGELVSAAHCSLLIEPLNTRVDHKGYILDSMDEANLIIQRVNNPSVKVLFDIYHQQITEGDLVRRITEYSPIIGHFHVADNPGRDRPGTGEINYHFVLQKASETVGDNVYAGLEYFPNEEILHSLEQVKAYLMK